MLHEMACSFVEEQFSLKGCVPFSWLLANYDNVAYVETNWTDAHDKVRTTRAMGQFIRENVTAYSFISEAWALASANIPEDIRPLVLDWAENRGLAELPDEFKDDIVMITSFDREGGILMSQYKVTIRHQRRGLNFLGPRVDNPMEADKVKGRMWNLFKEPRD